MAPAALVAVTGLFSLLPGWTAALHSPIIDSPPLGAARIPAGTLSSGTLPGTLTPVAASITELETRAFLEAHDGDPARAQEALDLKTSWRHAQGRVTIAHVAPFYRSEGIQSPSRVSSTVRATRSCLRTGCRTVRRRR